MVTKSKGVQIVSGSVVTDATFFGLSTDSKPTGVANGSCFVEMNTGKIYFFDAAGTQWIEWGA